MLHPAPCPPPATSLHLALRAATATVHEAVERRFAGHDLACRDQYAAFLAMQGAALVPLERALEAAGIARDLPDWPQRRRADALLGDLAALGRGAPAATPAPMIAPGAEALGAAYVLEGSRLGAAVLRRRLAPGLPDAFLRHGAGAGLWRVFLARLAQVPPAGAPAAIRGARAAFARFLAGPAT